MATLNRAPEGMLRRPVRVRSLLVCLLLVLLVAGAASYTHGSRYALVGHGPFLTAPLQPAGSGPALTEVPPPPAAIPCLVTPSSDSPIVPVQHHAGPAPDPDSMERDQCERRPAPRGEPAPLRTGAVDAPLLLLYEEYGAGLSAVPSEPDLPTLTVIELSVSRT